MTVWAGSRAGQKMSYRLLKFLQIEQFFQLKKY